MKLQANADTSKVTFKAELDEVELRIIARALRATYWNFIGTQEDEDACNDMVKKINNMLPVMECEIPKEIEYGAA